MQAKAEKAPDVHYGYESKVNNEECKKVRKDLGKPEKYRPSLPLYGADSVSAPSVRMSDTTNTNIFDSKRVKAIDKQGYYPAKK